MKFSLRQIQVFLATSEFQNISRAAEKLSMSQSAASSSLKELEAYYGVALFDRIGKRLQLNTLGKTLLPKAEALLNQADELECLLEQKLGQHHLKVGATLTIGNYLAVELMAQFMSQNPHTQVDLSVANTEQICAQVLGFKLDVGLIEGEYHHKELEVIPWIEDELTMFSHPNHPLAKKNKLSDGDLLDAKWIVREHGSGTRQTFDRAMHGLLPKLNITLELQHTEAIKRAVEAQLGIGCLSRIALEQAFNRGDLVPLKSTGRDLSRRFYFVIHKQKFRSQALNGWLELCKEMS